MPHRRTAQILVVDDSPTTRDAVTRMLEQAGFQVIVAESGAGGLARAAADAPDLVVLDVELPDIRGTEVCQRLKSDPATWAIPVLHISATALTHADQRFALDTGADGYLIHPIDPGVLVATVRSLLRMRAAVDRIRLLHAVTAELSIAVTPAQVATILLGHGVRALGAEAGAVALLTPDGAALQMAELSGRHEWLTGRRRGDAPGERVAFETSAPISVCAWTGEPVWFESLEAYRASYPHLAGEGGAGDLPQALACVAIPGDGRALGVLGLAFAEGRRFPEPERVFLAALAMHGAHALERARLFQLEQQVRKQAEDTMEALRRSVRAREDILAIVSHDLRNPLSVILMDGSLMRQSAPEGDEGAGARKQAERILRSATRMDLLIRALLDVASIESGRFTVERKPEALGPIVAEAVEAVAALAADKSIEVERAAGDVTADCDRARVLQVLVNLLTNAVKFTPERGGIRVTASEQAGHAVVSVADTGPGISAEMLPKLFDRYARSSRAGGGDIGLGLYITKGIVEAHGGTLSVDSRPGAGCTFSFLLPLPPQR